MSVTWRQTRGLTLLNSTDNNRAFSVHEKYPIIYWFSLTLCLGDLRFPLIPITGNTVPLSRETISHLSAQQENMRKHLPCPEELMTLWWKSAPPPSLCLPYLTSALPLCQSSLWPLESRGGSGGCSGVWATEQQSRSDHQELNSAAATGGRVIHMLQFVYILCVGCTGSK